MTPERMRTLALAGVGLVVVGALVSATLNVRGGLLIAGGVAILAAVGFTYLRQRRRGE